MFKDTLVTASLLAVVAIALVAADSVADRPLLSCGSIDQLIRSCGDLVGRLFNVATRSVGL